MTPRDAAASALKDHEIAMKIGTLFIVSAPSGAGKTSLLKALLEGEEGIVVSVSHTTRPMRPGEVDGINYHFIDTDRFRRMVAGGAFIEHAEVFGNFYGTAEAAIRGQLEQGLDVILEIDWQGARQVRRRFADTVSIFILPPTPQALQARLSARGQDDDAVIAGRMAEARSEMSHYGEYDYLIINDSFTVALEELRQLVRSQRLRLCIQEQQLQDQLRALLA
jgi:guanylate kinase